MSYSDKTAADIRRAIRIDILWCVIYATHVYTYEGSFRNGNGLFVCVHYNLLLTHFSVNWRHNIYRSMLIYFRPFRVVSAEGLVTLLFKKDKGNSDIVKIQYRWDVDAEKLNEGRILCRVTQTKPGRHVAYQFVLNKLIDFVARWDMFNIEEESVLKSETEAFYLRRIKIYFLYYSSGTFFGYFVPIFSLFGGRNSFR